MTADNDETQRWISAGDIANYAVCPEAWRLKMIGAGQRRENPRTAESREIRREWVEKQELSSRLAFYAKIAYGLLLSLTIVVFLLERYRPEFLAQIVNRMHDADAPHGSPTVISDVPEEILSLILVLGLIIYMWDFFLRRMARTRRESGLDDASETVALKGSSELPGREYIWDAGQLRSKPDALIREGSQLIPVDVHPLTNKVRDRHVLQLLTHLRLIEQVEKVRPDYGVLLMGKEQRRVQIKNTDEKQRWLETLIDEMRSIMDGVPAVPSPSRFKCRSCDVRKICSYSMYDEEEPT